MDKPHEVAETGPPDDVFDDTDIVSAVTCDTDDGLEDLPDEIIDLDADAGAVNAAEREPREPLFDYIDRQGDPDTPEKEKIKPVFDLGKVLSGFGVKEKLAQELGRISEALRPLAALVLKRKPEEDERNALEGRGAYLDNIPVYDTQVTMYNKGSGSANTFDEAAQETDEQPEAAFAGFPNDTGGLFHDQPANSPHPRMTGTETVSWGIMEAVTASDVLAYVIKNQGWERPDEVVKAGLTIPLNVMDCMELTRHLNGLIRRYEQNSADDFERKGLEWEGNRHIGIVSMIVPGNSRIDGGTNRDAIEAVGRISSPETAQVTARTLRLLLDAGYCYSQASSHGQNLYAKGLVAQADNSDLVTLGDYRGWNKADLPETDEMVFCDGASAREERLALIFKQFDEQRMLTPLHAPLVASRLHVPWEQTVLVQKTFWGEMMRGAADPQAVDRMMHLMPFMRTEFNVAAANLLLDNADQTAWEAAADQKRQIFASYEAEYGVLTEYQSRLENNLSKVDTTPVDITELHQTGKLHSAAVLDFLKTGDEQHLRDDPILGKAVRLADAIEAVPDSLMRDRLLFEAWGSFDQIEPNRLVREPDMVTAFEGRQYDKLVELIEAGRYEDARNMMGVLRIAVASGGIGKFLSLERDRELNGHKYTRLALEDDADYADLYLRAHVEELSARIGRLAHVGGEGFGEMIQRALNGGSPLSPSNPSHEAEARGQPNVREVLRQMLNSSRIPAADLQAAAAWMEKYNVLASVVEDRHHLRTDEIVQAFDYLDGMLPEIAERFPELALAHNCLGASQFASLDRERSRRYFNAAMNYYYHDFSERRRLADRPSVYWNDYRWMNDARLRTGLAERYTAMGLPHVAFYYQHNDILGNHWHNG